MTTWLMIVTLVIAVVWVINRKYQILRRMRHQATSQLSTPIKEIRQPWVMCAEETVREELKKKLARPVRLSTLTISTHSPHISLRWVDMCESERRKADTNHDKIIRVIVIDAEFEEQRSVRSVHAWCRIASVMPNAWFLDRLSLEITGLGAEGSVKVEFPCVGGEEEDRTTVLSSPKSISDRAH